jgi:hypothetical protein
MQASSNCVTSCVKKKADVISALRMAVAAGILLLPTASSAQTQAYKQLSAQWWQWALSIPVDNNPLADPTGENCMVGQRGSNWFLAGVFGGSSATRACTVPAGVNLFFPVANFVGFDTPNACGQDSTPLSSSFYRGLAADFVEGLTEVSASLDGVPIDTIQRVQSKVFWLALPEANLFAEFCAPFGGLPAGLYSPAVDDGYYVRLNPLAPGPHRLILHAVNPSAGFTLDVTYNLTGVPVVTK